MTLTSQADDALDRVARAMAVCHEQAVDKFGEWPTFKEYATAAIAAYSADMPTRDGRPMTPMECGERIATLEARVAGMRTGLERIAWHELTWRDARDAARAVLEEGE